MRTLPTAGAAALLALGLTASAAPLASKDVVQVQAALDGTGSDAHETNLGDLIADAARASAGTPVALIPADEITDGALVPAGRTSADKIVATLRYGRDATDTVVVLALTGDQLIRAAERSVSRVPKPFNGFLQVSGLQIRYNPSQPEGKRVSLVGVGGGEVDASRTYRVAMPRALAEGGLGYFQIWNAKKPDAQDTQESLAHSLTTYLSQHRTVGGPTEGRVSSQ